MALSTYSDLRTSIALHAWRTGDVDFEAATVDLVALAHSNINLDVRHRLMEATAVITVTDGVGPLPDGYIEFIEVTDGSSRPTPLTPCEPSFGDAEYGTNSSGTAKHFAILGSTIKTYPASAANIPIRFYQEVDPLAEDSDANWVLTKFPGLYLYGALKEAEAYMMNDPRIATWDALYSRLVAKINGTDLKARFARSSSRVRGPTP